MIGIKKLIPILTLCILFAACSLASKTDVPPEAGKPRKGAITWESD